MLHPVTFRTLALAACGWLLAWDACALTLGRAQGAAWIGRPLEVVIPVTLDGSDTQGPCAGADLFHGEERVRAPIVRWEPGVGTQGVLRVTSVVPVDEPMVTLYLRTGCGQSASRRFVFLSELPPATEPQRAALLAVQAPVVSAPPAPSARDQAAAASRPARQARARRTAAPQQPRLKLEPLDLSVERDPTLRLTTELKTQASADPEQRRAAAALWLVVQKTPDDALQEALRLQGAERELGSLRTETRQSAALLQEMRSRIEQAQAGRAMASWLVLALATVLAALLLWLAVRWHRVRQVERVGRWFEAHGNAAQGVMADTAPTDLPLPLVPLTPAAVARGTNVTTAPTPVSAAAPAWAHGEELHASRGASMRMVGVEELIDVHDKADFFLSIGETEQAIAALESHVHANVETGALAWLDLLELYHSLGRRLEFERLRSEFGQRFTAQVPDFEHFDQPTATLENYSRALSRIVALWPSQQVLDVIEESIFRKAGLPGAEPFSLQAYRELVLLYHIAKEMLPAKEDATRPVAAAGGVTETSLQPLAAADAHDPTLADRERLMIPPASARLGVDIDLEELPRDGGDSAALDFDVSVYDDMTDITAADPARKRG